MFINYCHLLICAQNRPLYSYNEGEPNV